MVEGLRGANVYLLRSGNGATLVDTGWAGDAGRALAQLQESGWGLSELQSMVLTHWHGDHSGNAAELAGRSGAQVVAHRQEVPHIERNRSVPPAPPVPHLQNWLAAHVLLRRPPCQVSLQVQDGDAIGASSGLQVIHTQGHSPGSTCLYQPEQRILFCGDALVSAHPVSGRPGLGLQMRLLAVGYARACASARRLSTLPAEVLCCGHGQPILEGAGEKMRRLLGDAGA